jgi:hypothetical protein
MFRQQKSKDSSVDRKHPAGRARLAANLLKGEARGQAFVLLAVSFLALLAFIGLVTDAGSIYVSYTQLQRAIDAAAVAAANNIKYPQASEAERKQKITEAAREMLAVHNVTGVDEMTVYLCTDSGLPTQFAAMCPQPGQPPRKLAFVQATQETPVYFLHIFGLQSFNLTASAVGEAAAVDLVVVLDTSESMGVNTAGYDPRDFNPNEPGGCNATNTCYPHRTAKDAAKALVQNLFHGYDQVAIVNFDYDAAVPFPLSSDLYSNDPTTTNALEAIDAIGLHDDAPAALVPWTLTSPNGGYRRFNPINPDDRDGDGDDADPGATCIDNIDNDGVPPSPPVPPGWSINTRDLWDDATGDPCDRDDILDAFDWNRDGDRDNDNNDPLPYNFEDTSLLSTCQGCGLRMAVEQLQANGRPTSVWVIVFLSDGVANMSDTNQTYGEIPADFRYGFCGTDPDTSFWGTYCIDWNNAGEFGEGRFCIDADEDECPPDATHTNDSGPYSVEDYAMDWVDTAALLESTNPDEPGGEDIIMYAIGLGGASAGENLLRYMANVGDDGSRANDPCAGVPALQNCGNYYYSPNASYLAQIFESIASRIFTKISR